MAKQRMIYSDVWEDDFFTSLTIFQRLLWIGLITSCADDQGRFQDNAALVRSKVFPIDDIQISELEAGLTVFCEAGRIARYTAGDKHICQIVNWWKYQTPRWAGRSIYPPPPGWTDRERYHAAGNTIEESNWSSKGGYTAGYIGGFTAGNTTNDVNGDVKDDVNGDGEVPPQPPTPDVNPEYGQLVTAYHENIGQVSKMIGDTLADDLKEYGLQWCLDAIQECVANNVRRWSYARAILERWKTDGRGNKPKKTAPAPEPVMYTPDPEPPGGWLKPDPERSRKLLAQVEEIARQKREALNGSTS